MLLIFAHKTLNNLPELTRMVRMNKMRYFMCRHIARNCLRAKGKTPIKRKSLLQPIAASPLGLHIARPDRAYGNPKQEGIFFGLNGKILFCFSPVPRTDSGNKQRGSRNAHMQYASHIPNT